MKTSLIALIAVVSGSVGGSVGGSVVAHAADRINPTADANTVGKPAARNETRNENMAQVRDATLADDGAMAQPLRRGVNYQVVDFEKGSAKLTDAAKMRLRSLLTTAKSSGRIDEAHIAVFADKPFPTDKDLPKADRTLAEKRISAIKTFLKNDLNFSSYKTYSMAERSNWFARAMGTDDAEIKSLFSQQGAPTNVASNDFRVVKQKGGPERAVILVEMKDRAARSPASVSGTTTSAGERRGKHPKY